MSEVVVVDHPLVQHKLSEMRDAATAPCDFRRLLREIAPFLVYEATRDLPLTRRTVQTPLAEMQAPSLAEPHPALLSVLRAGNGLLGAVLELLPQSPVGHVGLYRDHVTLEAHEYYFKVPPDLPSRRALLLDPMLATGHSAVAALERVSRVGPRAITFVSLVAAPEGVEVVRRAFPDVRIVTAAIDERLNDVGYIVPGLGDAGDRIYGTVG